ncbi:hypothetical protein C8F04DRAFT_1200784 [Mycena alexandri]|uniref:Uncharacterized protein n=1 Tax=Mycena alexandri TaxID=1745969 RepID=A0AAD6RXM7_9AGAR|nr:hypothetical protein C8F04DRAFT_1200784 [Mycena alexandri]
MRWRRVGTAGWTQGRGCEEAGRGMGKSETGGDERESEPAGGIALGSGTSGCRLDSRLVWTSERGGGGRRDGGSVVREGRPVTVLSMKSVTGLTGRWLKIAEGRGGGVSGRRTVGDGSSWSEGMRLTGARPGVRPGVWRLAKAGIFRVAAGDMVLPDVFIEIFGGQDAGPEDIRFLEEAGGPTIRKEEFAKLRIAELNFASCAIKSDRDGHVIHELYTPHGGNLSVGLPCVKASTGYHPIWAQERRGKSKNCNFGWGVKDLFAEGSIMLRLGYDLGRERVSVGIFDLDRCFGPERTGNGWY